MGRRVNFSLIPDMETLDAEGRYATVMIYPDGRLTIRPGLDDEGEAPIDPENEPSN